MTTECGTWQEVACVAVLMGSCVAMVWMILNQCNKD